MNTRKSDISAGNEETTKTDKFEIVVRAIMQRVQATMPNPAWPKSRYVCSKDVSEQRYKVMMKDQVD
jgi:hypothetical protein